MIIRVLIVDDHPAFRAGLRDMVNNGQDTGVVGEAGTGLEAVEKARLLKPDVILMDINMPKMSGIEATRIIVKEYPAVHVIMLTAFGSEAAGGDRYIFEALQAGAEGYLLKTAGKEEILRAISSVYRGESLLDPKVTASFVERIRQNTLYAGEKPDVTDYELQIVKYLAQGMSNGQIGKHLYRSTSSIEKTLNSFCRKFNLENRVQVLIFAVQQGLISPNELSLPMKEPC